MSDPLIRNINSLPSPYLHSATPYKQENFSPVTINASRFLMSTINACKVIFLGDVGVGKTSLIKKFCYRAFNENYKATIGVDFEVELFNILNVNFNMHIWDTAGQERFKCITKTYYRDASAIILVFSLNNLDSLENIKKWLAEALTVTTNKPLLFLVGAKQDLVGSSPIYIEAERRATAIAREIEAEYWSTSANTGEQVHFLFNRIAALAFDETMRKDHNQHRYLAIFNNPISLIENVDENAGRGNCNSKCF